MQRVSGMAVEDDALLNDLRRVAADLGGTTVGQKRYRTLGRYDDTTVTRRFGSWNDALGRAGLSLSNSVDLSDVVLFENLLVLWSHFGRQPRRAELAGPPSTVSQSPYLRRFGSWRSALEAFVAFANAADPEDLPSSGQGDQVPTAAGAPRTGRDPSVRLRLHVLRRDNFRCVQCGASPASTAGVALHVDHIVAWSKGGETALDNLQTLCDRCNLGKGDL
jgi:hypothetical protein